MNKRLALAAILLVLAMPLAVTPSLAQRASDLFGGDLPQEYGNDINNKFDLRQVDEMLSDPAVLEQFYSAEQLAAFFDNAVVRVSFYPDGSYVTYARQGGELAGLKLGRKKMAPESRAWESDHWLLRTGQFAIPKRPARLALTLAAAGNEVTVECMNMFERSDQTVTFYVGPMRGLRCLGMVDAEALPFDEVVRTADSKTAARAPNPGS